MKCPLCKEQAVQEYRPFCSKLCQDRDLLNWINEDYKIPIKDQQEEEQKDD